MGTSLITEHGMQYYAGSDTVGFLSGFNALVLRLEVLLSEMDGVSETLTTTLATAISDINEELNNIKQSDSLQNSNILALQTAVNNINTAITNLDSEITNLTTPSNKTAITTNASAINLNNFSFYIKKGGWCFFQIGFSSTDTEQHEIGRVLPNSDFGNFIYLYSKNGSEARIEVSGNVRLTASTVGVESYITGCYPCN